MDLAHKIHQIVLWSDLLAFLFSWTTLVGMASVQRLLAQIQQVDSKPFWSHNELTTRGTLATTHVVQPSCCQD